MNSKPSVLDRVLPNSQDAERAVLGAILLAPVEITPVVRSKVTEEYFYHAAHQVVFREACALQDEYRSVDIVTLTQRMESDGTLAGVGGAVYLAELVGAVPTTANVEHYLDIVVEMHQRRQMIQAGYELQAKAFDTTTDAKDVCGETIRQLVTMGQRETDTKHIGLVVPEALREIQEQIANPNEISGLTTGYNILDKITHGYKPGEFWIVAGLPGTGKTALAVESACHCADRTGQAVGIFSLEQKDRALVRRIIASHSQINMRQLRAVKNNAGAMQRLTTSAERIAKLPVYINENPRLTPARIRGEIMLWVQRYNVKVVFLDYIGIVAQSRRGTDPRLHVNEVSDELRSCAKEYGITVVGLSQFSREVEKQNRRPRNSDLKESGNLEADAHVILLLSKDVQEHELPPTWSGIFSEEQRAEFMHINISKQREGDCQPVFLRFVKEFTRYENIYTTHTDSEPEPEPSRGPE